MDRLKSFAMWLIIVIAFWIFTNGIIYLMLNAEEIGIGIYNMTHQEEMTNEVK